MTKTTDFHGNPAQVADTIEDMRSLGHWPKPVNVHGFRMLQCRICGCRLGSLSSGAKCKGFQQSRPEEARGASGVVHFP